jgi:hypothetical protein
MRVLALGCVMCGPTLVVPVLPSQLSPKAVGGLLSGEKVVKVRCAVQ